MPRDASGAVADIIACPLSTVNRLNVSRDIEMYLGAAERAQRGRIQEAMDRNDWDTAWRLLIEFYQIVSPWQYEAALSTSISRKDHIRHVLRKGIQMFLPANSPKDPLDIVRELRDKYPAVHGPVTFTSPAGKTVTTKEPVLIGNAYYMLLEKTATDWSGVSSAKLQVHGLPAKLTTMDRHASPGGEQPIRITGEDEIRAFAASCGPYMASDLLDQSNNPAVHRHIADNILKSKRPMALDRAVDRALHPRGGGRPQLHYQSNLAAAGFKFVRGKNDA